MTVGVALVLLLWLASIDGVWLGLVALMSLPLLIWLRDQWRFGQRRQLCTDGEQWWWSHRPHRAGRLRQSRVWPWWVYLEWQGGDGRDEASVLIDSLPADEFRRLRMLAAQAPLR